MTSLKRIEAIIKPFTLDEVKEALERIGVKTFTVVEIKHFDNNNQTQKLYRGAEYVVEFLPKVRVSVLVPDNRVDEIVQAIIRAAATGRIGDGTIEVLPVEQHWDIGTGKQLME